MRASPAWLLEAIRPKPVPAHMSIHADYQVRDGHSYALAAVRGVLAEMSAAQPGTRNAAAYRTSARLIELTLAQWANLDVSEVQQAYLGACRMTDVDPSDPFTDGEAWAAWFSAQRRVTRPAVLPPTDLYGTAVPWVVPPSDFDQAGQDPAGGTGLFVQPGALMPVAAQMINGPTGQAFVAPDPFEMAVAQEVGRQLVREEATRRIRERAFPPVDFDQLALGIADLRKLPEPEPLVQDYLFRDTLARINGPSGHGKSFVAVDLLCCVGAGKAWHGRAVRREPGLMVVAEGVAGMRARAEAWQERHQVDDDDLGVVFIAQAVQIGGSNWPRFVAWCAGRGFGFIVLDTQARNTVGRKENDATEMGEVMAGLDDLRAATGACVSMVHHRGLAGEHGRGSTAVKGAMDTELDVSKTGVTLTVKVTKQKDHVEPAPLLLTMNPLGNSVVLISDLEAPAGSLFTSPMRQLTGQERAALAIAQALIDGAGSGLTRAEAMAHGRVATSLPATDTVKKMFRRAWADLVGLGRIAKAAGREAYFWIEVEGLERLAPNPGKTVEGGPELYVS